MLTLVLPCVPEPHFTGGKGRESALEVTDVLGFALTRALLEPARLLLSNWGRAGLSTESQGVIKQGCLGHHWAGSLQQENRKAGEGRQGRPGAEGCATPVSGPAQRLTAAPLFVAGK